jgi:hypothetical protein
VFISSSSYSLTRIVGAYLMMSKAINEDSALLIIAKTDPLSFIGLGATVGKHSLVVAIFAFIAPTIFYTLLLSADHPARDELIAAILTQLIMAIAIVTAYHLSKRQEQKVTNTQSHATKRSQ